MFLKFLTPATDLSLLKCSVQRVVTKVDTETCQAQWLSAEITTDRENLRQHPRSGGDGDTVNEEGILQHYVDTKLLCVVHVLQFCM